MGEWKAAEYCCLKRPSSSINDFALEEVGLIYQFRFGRLASFFAPGVHGSAMYRLAAIRLKIMSYNTFLFLLDYLCHLEVTRGTDD
jgi:hypothetical protein